MVRMRARRGRWRGIARSVAAAVAAVVVIAGPGAPDPLGPVDGQPVVLAAASSVHPAQGDGPQDSGGGGGGGDSGGGDSGGSDSGGTNVSGNPSGGDDKSSSGGGEASAPEPDKSNDGPSGGEASGPERAKPDDGGSNGEAAGAERAAPNANVGDTQSGQAAGGAAGQGTPAAASGAQRSGEIGDEAGQAQVAGGPSTPGAPAEGGQQAAVSDLGKPVGGQPSEAVNALQNGNAVVGDPTQPNTQTTATTGTPAAPGALPTESRAEFNGTPVTVDPGTQGTLNEYQASLPGDARSQPLDFGSKVVTPDQRNTLVRQEGGNVDQVNSAIEKVATPGAQVTQTQVLLRDDEGRFGNQTLFQVTGKDGKPQLIDAQGATYQNVDDYLENNQLDDSWTMIRPANLGAAGEGPQQLVSGPAHNSTFSQKFGEVVDAAAPYAGLAGGAVVTAASLAGEPVSFGAATPGVMAGWALMGTSAAAIAARSGEDLFTRYQHNRSISPSDPQARADYLGLVGALGGGVGTAGKLASKPLLAAGGDGLAFGAGGQTLADGGTQLYNNWGNLTPDQQREQATQLATGGMLMATPFAGRGGPRGEPPFLPGKRPALAEVDGAQAARGTQKPGGVIPGAKPLPDSPIPQGFESRAQFTEFSGRFRQGLAAAGYGKTEPMIRGSSVTGESFKSGRPFDEGRVSDWDISLAGEDIFSAAQRAGIKLRGGGTRTGPLNNRQLRDLGLMELRNNLRASSGGRPLSFMVYRSPQDVANRGPSITFPR